MAKRPTKKTPETRKINTQGGAYYEGGQHAGRDIIMGDQYNYTFATPPAQMQTPDQLRDELARVLAELEKLQAQAEKPIDKDNVSAAVSEVQKAAQEAAAPKPDPDRIKAALERGKALLTLSGENLRAAVMLGTALGQIGLLAANVFGVGG